MAYFRCSGGNSGDGGIFPPQGKMYRSGTVEDYAASTSITSWGGMLIYNGKDLEGKRIRVSNNNARDLYFNARYIKDNAVTGNDNHVVTASGGTYDCSYIYDADLVIVTCYCRSGVTSALTLGVQVRD